MKIVCSLLGILLGVFVTNTLWVTTIDSRAWLMIGSCIVFVVMLLAIAFDWRDSWN
jgi:uncharacterized membrane protein YesL